MVALTVSSDEGRGWGWQWCTSSVSAIPAVSAVSEDGGGGVAALTVVVV